MSALNTTLWQGAGRRIHMQEVGLRDGLQMEKAFVPTADKIALCNALSDAGLAKIEVTSFTSPTAIPALKDAEIVMREITRRPGTIYAALVPNLRGAERAIESRTDELNLVMSVSATHNLANLRMTQEQSFAALAQVVALAQELSGVRDIDKVSFGTEGSQFQRAGIPTVVCGPGSIEQAHKPNEYVTLDQVAQCERFIRRLIDRVCL